LGGALLREKIVAQNSKKFCIIADSSKLGQIAAGFAVPPLGPSFEWDDQAQVLVVPDPYLLFYLRWSVALEREADALM